MAAECQGLVLSAVSDPRPLIPSRPQRPSREASVFIRVILQSVVKIFVIFVLLSLKTCAGRANFFCRRTMADSTVPRFSDSTVQLLWLRFCRAVYSAV